MIHVNTWHRGTAEQKETKMTNYIVMTGDGDLLCDGVSEYEIERVAQAWADRLAETVYYSESGSTDDSDGEDSVTAVEPRSTTKS